MVIVPVSGQGPPTDVQPPTTGAVPGSLERPKVTPREPSEGWGTTMVMHRAGLAVWLSRNPTLFPGKEILGGGLGRCRLWKLVPTDAPTIPSELGGGPLNLPYPLEVQMQFNQAEEQSSLL